MSSIKPNQTTTSPKCRILAAARELFFSKGVAAVTTDMLVKKAKTSKMTLYKYFENKDAILEQVVSEDVSRIFEPLSLEVHDLAGYRKVVFDFFENFVDIIFDPEIVRFDQLMISQALTHSDLTQSYFNRTYQPTIERIEQLVEQGQTAGYVKVDYSAALLTDILVSSISGLSYTKRLHGFMPNNEDVKSKIAGIVSITLGLEKPSK